MKVRDLVHASARAIGIVASGENMTDVELSDAVSALNMLLGQWSTSRDYVFSTQDIEIDLNGNALYQVEAKLISDDAKINDEEIKIYRDIAQNKPKNCIEYTKVLNGYELLVPQKITGKLTIQSLISPPYMAQDLKKFESAVETAVKVPLNQNQFDALVSLTYNIGIGAFKDSTLLKKLNSKDYKGAAAQFDRWNKGGGKVMQGLVNRRAKERKLFEKAV